MKFTAFDSKAAFVGAAAISLETTAETRTNTTKLYPTCKPN